MLNTVLPCLRIKLCGDQSACTRRELKIGNPSAKTDNLSEVPQSKGDLLGGEGTQCRMPKSLVMKLFMSPTSRYSLVNVEKCLAALMFVGHGMIAPQLGARDTGIRVFRHLRTWSWA